jgi:Sigma-70 region 2
VVSYDVTERLEHREVPKNILDDPERLARSNQCNLNIWIALHGLPWRISLWMDPRWWRPKPLPRANGPAINDLVAHRWRSPLLTREQEADIVRRVREPMAFDKLLAGFHRKILQIAGGHMPKHWRRRLAFRDKHMNNLLFEDLVAAGVMGLWQAVPGFDAALGFAFWTKARLRVLGAISDEARRWRRHSQGETRIERWLYAHPGATPEQVLLRQKQSELTGERGIICHSLREAAQWIEQFWAWKPTKVDEPAGTSSFQIMYSCFDQYTLAPQLEYHELLSRLVDDLAGAVFDAGPDVGNASHPKTPLDLRDFTETAFLRFKNGRRQVARQKAASYCYGIVVNPELEARALANLEFAKKRWESRVKLTSWPAKTHKRWSIKWLNGGCLGQGSLGGPEHENKHIISTYRQGNNRFRWVVESRSISSIVTGELLSVLESPSWHCLRPKPCEFCEAARNRSRSHNVTPQSILSAA